MPIQGVIPGAEATATWTSAQAEGEENHNRVGHTADYKACLVEGGPAYTWDKQNFHLPVVVNDLCPLLFSFVLADCFKNPANLGLFSVYPFSFDPQPFKHIILILLQHQKLTFKRLYHYNSAFFNKNLSLKIIVSAITHVT